MTLLSVHNLDVSIHGTQIIENISFKIDKGETLGVVGESGSGKSMTALALMQLLPQGSRLNGDVIFNGRNIKDLSESELCSMRGLAVGMVFQEPMTALNPVLTIGQQVAETLVVHGGYSSREAFKVARERLDRVELPEERFPLNTYPHELSGGQRQRVCIALAVALRPSLLIADEPTTALDVSTQAQILNLLRSLVDEEKMAMMLITHDLAVVAGMANKVAVMQKGKIVEAGPVEDLFCNMVHDYTKKLFSASRHIPERHKPDQDHTLLQVNSVVREYSLKRKHVLARPDRLRAVNNVSFSLRQGESLGLVGESGCGKSTLTRALLGLEPLQSGHILFEGTEISHSWKMTRAMRRKMQVVFQDPYGSFNPRHKVGRLVAEPLYLCDTRPSRKERQNSVADALTEVGLQTSDMEKYIHEFSGGQRQRIAIARSLVLRPALIILDEAVSALDVSIRAQILDLLADLQTRLSLSYLFISHDLNVVRAVTDRVMVMQNGVIVEEGQTDAVFHHPQHEYTKMLLASAPEIPAKWTH